ncbi:MAG: TetR/AcrR family transcriptional regulator [Clostridia bacterium]|nr:TetR/AcrR family transcriptional regulator [Clostridia bacterium]
MYCGNNKTALASQRQVAGALMRLIREKPYAQISVSELCKTAGVSRQTFYSLFTSRENVVTFTLQSACCCTLAEAPVSPGGPKIRLLARSYSEYLVRNRDLIKLLVDNRIDYLLYDSFEEALNASECLFGDLDPCLRRYASAFYAGGISCVARQYAREGCSSGADHLEELLTALLSGALFSEG